MNNSNVNTHDLHIGSLVSWICIGTESDWQYARMYCQAELKEFIRQVVKPGHPWMHGLHPSLIPDGMKLVPTRSEQEIVEQTERLAAEFSKMSNWRLESGRYATARQPRAHYFWILACVAQEQLTDTDPENAVANLDLPEVLTKKERLQASICQLTSQIGGASC